MDFSNSFLDVFESSFLLDHEDADTVAELALLAQGELQFETNFVVGNVPWGEHIFFQL